MSSSTTIIEKVKESNGTSLEQTQLRIEQILLGIDSAVNQFISTPLVNSSIHEDFDLSDFQQIELLSKGTYQLQTFQFGIQNIYLASIKHNWLISNRGFERFHDWKTKEIWLSQLEKNRTSFWLSHQDLDTLSDAWDQDIPSKSVFLMKKLPIHSISPTGFLLVVIPGYETEKFLYKNSSIQNISILDEDYRVLATKSDIASNPIFDSILQHMKTEQVPNGNFTIDTAEGDQLITYRQSSYNGWTYMSVVPLEDIKKESSKIGLFTVIVCLVTLALTIIISYLGSHQMYRPIRLLYEEVVGRGKFFSKSSNNELELIGEKVRSVLSTQAAMSEKIKGQTHQLKEYFVIKMLNGEVKPHEFVQKLEWFGFANHWKIMSVVAVEIHSLEKTRYEMKDKDLLLFAIKNIVEEWFDNSERLVPVLKNQILFVIFGSNEIQPEEWKKNVHEKAENLRGKLNEVLMLSVSIGISRPYFTLKDSSSSSKEAMEALKYRIRFEEDAIFDSQEVLPSIRKMKSQYPDFIVEQLLDAMKLGDNHRANVLFKMFLQEVLKDEIGYEEYQFAMLRLLIELITLVQNQSDVALAIIFGETSWMDQFLSLKTMNDYEHWFTQVVIGPMIVLLEDRMKLQQRTISQKVKDIIHAEFTSELTLEQCASRLNYHPSYIRQVFLKETGLNFSSYLAEYRLTMAKRWLIKSDIRINEIAEKLGYNNAQNFIRYFRKMEGITPGQFRDQNRS